MKLVYAIHTPQATALRVLALAAQPGPRGGLGREVYPVDVDGVLRGRTSVATEAADRRILMQLSMSQSPLAREISVVGTGAFRLLEAMAATGRLYFWDERSAPIRWRKSKMPGGAGWQVLPDGQVQPVIEVGEAKALLIPSTPPVAFHPKALTLQPVASGLPDALAGIWHRSPPMSTERALQFFERQQAEFRNAKVPPPPHVRMETLEAFTPVPTLSCVVTDEGAVEGLVEENASGLLKLEMAYEGCLLSPDDPRERVRFLGGDGVCYDVCRQTAFEARAVQRLRELGFVPYSAPVSDLFSRVHYTDCWAPAGADSVDWDAFLAATWPALAAVGWRWSREETEPRIPAPEDWYADMEAHEEGWFAFETGVLLDGERLNLLPAIQRYLSTRVDQPLSAMQQDLEERGLVVRQAGRLVVVPGERVLAIIRHLFELYSGNALDADQKLRLTAWRVSEMTELEALDSRPWQLPEALMRQAAALRQGVELLPAVPDASLQATLRPYQALGLSWLRFLRDHELGGILADDMGLGKTVQTIAALLEGRATHTLPSLVVCPTSVLGIWQAELERFAPSLRVRVMHGGARHDGWGALESVDIVLTTYALVRRDRDEWVRRSLHYLILDEAQFVKNPRTRSARVVRELNARHRLCLTGTPIENRLLDLWSLMDFVMPGYLGGAHQFTDVYQKPLERGDAPVLREALRSRVSPLILRRTKDAVATDLPAKTMMTQTLRLSEAQHAQYQTVRLAMQERVRATIRERGLQKSQFNILEALLRLRQVCCDPRLAARETSFTLPADSCKLAWLMDVLPEMLEEGRRVLLFSQFTRVLGFIEEALTGAGIAYVKLTGGTRDRATPINRFQSGDVPLFLISLKAGGTGLNLTAADTVILYDPWWNPAAENQAIDRAHRIGQEKPVFVYRLLTRKTVEERIVRRQAEKLELADSVVRDRGRVERLHFSEEEIDALFAPPG